MVTFSEAVRRSGRLALCAVLAVNESVNALISPIAGDSLGLYPLTSGLRRQLCSDDPGNDPVFTPEFAGGQCETNYSVTWGSYSRYIGGCGTETAGGNTVGGINGPIRGIAFQNPNPGATLCPGSPGQIQGVIQRDGSFVGLVGGTGQGLVSRVPLTFTRQDEQPDDCGDLAPPLGPPGNVSFGDEITYNIDESTEITNNINFTFCAYLCCFRWQLAYTREI